MAEVVSKSKDYRLLVAAPNTHYHFPLAMPRAIIADLEPQFSQYPANKFEFLLGAACSLDAHSNSFTVTLNKGGQKVVKYDRLITVIGSSTKDGMPWKLGASAGITLDSLHELQDKIRRAQTVAVAGGGLTGTETAGELGFEYASQSKKEVIFIYNDALPLPFDVLESVRKQAVTELTNLGVKMIPKTHVTDVTTEGANMIIKVRGSNEKMSSVLAQAYIPSLGLSPNTAFAPASMRNANGYLKQMTTLQVEGHPNIFVVGDAGSLEPNRAAHTESQATQFIKNLSTILSGGQMLEYSMGRFLFIDITPALSTGERMMSNSSEKFGRGQLTSLQLFIYVVFRC
ncbi:putative apoptosis-inducing factor [Trichoderma camerunense]